MSRRLQRISKVCISSPFYIGSSRNPADSSTRANPLSLINSNLPDIAKGLKKGLRIARKIGVEAKPEIVVAVVPDNRFSLLLVNSTANFHSVRSVAIIDLHDTLSSSLYRCCTKQAGFNRILRRSSTAEYDR